MNFFNMAFQNMEKKSERYITYFISTAFAVFIFYIFCAIYYNPEFGEFHSAASKISIIFKLSAFLVFGFSSIFVYYSNALFMKSRKKEFAIYLLLGMREREIGALLMWESAFIGVGSIACGIGAGMLFSRFFAMVLMKLMLGGAPGNSLSFQLSWQPIVISLCVFLFLFIVNALYSLRRILKSQLIHLLSAEKMGEKIPKTSLIASVTAIILLVCAYCVLLSFHGEEGASQLIMPIMLCGVLITAGTFLLFRNIAVWFILFLKKRNRIFFKTSNYISLTQLIYRIRANANLFGVIALLSAFTISLMSAIISFYISLNGSMQIYAPYSYVCRNIDEETHRQVENEIKKEPAVEQFAVTELEVLTTTGSLEGYQVDTNSEYGKVTSKEGEPFTIDIIKFSDYQNVVQTTQAKESDGNKGAIYVDSLKNNECLFLDGNYGHEYSQDAQGKDILITTDENETSLKIAATSLFKYMGAAHARTTLVISNDMYQKLFARQENYEINHCIGYKFTNPLELQELYDRLDQIVPEQNRDKSYLKYHQIIFNMYGAYIFIGIFLGVLFLMATGSIIFYKQLMEAREDAKRFDILQKIGLLKKEAVRIVCTQIAIVFLLPFSVALLHVLFLLLSYNQMVYTITVDSPVLLYSLCVVFAYFVIYAIFYLLSVNGYLKTVWKENQ